MPRHVRFVPFIPVVALAFCCSTARSQPKQPAIPPSVNQADVIVYGSTPSGFCAAIAAAREGASVLLLEPTQHVGGVNTGGLCWSDSNQTVRSTMKGLFEEWHQRIANDYARRGVKLPYDVAIKDATPWTYEPHIAARITREMLDEAKVQVRTGMALTAVTKTGPRITALHTRNEKFTAGIYIDTTYEGDLLAAAGVSWTIGREGRAKYGETLAGKQYPKPRMDISGFDRDGKPLPLITTIESGAEADGDRNVMAYSFRLCLTRDPANRLPFPKPKRYDPARFEVIRRYYAQADKPVLLWDLYPLPGNKWDANNGIGKQFSLGLIGAGNGWSEADPDGRTELFDAYRQYTLELYEFLTTDPSVPKHLREQLGELGLCKDEFPKTDHWSPQLYVREGRRMQGLYVLRQQDIMMEPKKDDPILISSFPIDSHDCRRVALPGGGVINEGTIFPVRMQGRRNGYPYQVPYRAILPKPGECENLLVPVALSASHVAYSSIRVEPTWMALGQSAGIAAALAARGQLAVQKVPYPQLRKRLLAHKIVLELPKLEPIPVPVGAVDPKSLPGLILDDKDATLKGAWANSVNFKPFIGTGYIHDQQNDEGKASATFQVTVPKSGAYQLLMAYSAHETRAKKVPIQITTGKATQTLFVDQTQPIPKGQHFRPIGVVTLRAGIQTTLTISNDGTSGFVILDAFQLLPMK